MNRPRVAALAVCVLGLGTFVSAHKPITSPYTYTADVQPILASRCGNCHQPSGVAPMSLVTYSDAVPWGESMRQELMTGHMPPWNVDRAPSLFRNAGALSAREINVLLTWATGGTPPGDLTKADASASDHPTAWALGAPDIVLPLPGIELGPEENERVAEFVVPTAFTSTRWLRAVDLLPGTPAIVRSATITVRGGNVPPGVERTLSLWQPGDEPVAASGTNAFMVPAGSELAVRIRYRKTWHYERMPMRDRSSIGLYLATAASVPVRSVPLSSTRATTTTRASRALAIYADDMPADTGVVVTATLPNGRRLDLIAFHPRPGWSHRFWYAQPIALPRGTRIAVRVVPARTVRLVLNVD
ncbi:MAG TPA: hypothetical protein VL173_08950 [Vicinamibacterales bacterium]|jgi:hypothetical protein|nr:hypothetical protein [Vicinamibacterales bacterium]